MSTKLAIKPYEGQHCETTALGAVLRHNGIELSEPLLFGLGRGLSFIFWNMKSFDFPFLGGRVKPDVLTRNVAEHLGFTLEVVETSSRKKAWLGVKEKLDAGQVVGLKLDAYHLEYFSTRIHFAGHYVAMFGYDDDKAFLVDTIGQGTRVETSLQSLADARAEKGPMSSRNLQYTLASNPARFDLKQAVRDAARENAREYLNPPISNVSYRGIERTAKEVVKWFERTENPADFATCAMLMERAGTGGALFRNLYHDFLNESFELTGDPIFATGRDNFHAIAADWTEVARLFENIAETQDRQVVDEVAALFKKLSVAEREAMERIALL